MAAAAIETRALRRVHPAPPPTGEVVALQAPHMSLGVVTVALVILPIAGWMLGMRSFDKRAIG